MFPKINVFLGLPLAEEGLRKSLRGSSWIGLHRLHGFSQPKRFHQIPFHRFRIISLYAQAGIFQGAVKGPVLHQREQIGIFMDILRERVWSFVSGPFYWQLKHFQEPGGFSPSHKLSLNHPALLELLSPVNPSPSQQLQLLSR